MSIKSEFLNLCDAISLIAHGTTSLHIAEEKYLTKLERKHAELEAENLLIRVLNSGKISATGLCANKKRNPIKDRWQAQQYCNPSGERISIPKEIWGQAHTNKQDIFHYGDKWVRTQDCQYNDIFLPLNEFETTFQWQHNIRC